MRSVEVTGKTRSDAIQNGLDELGIELADAEIEILDEGSRGLFGIGAREVRVRITTEAPGKKKPAVIQRKGGNEAAALLSELINRMGIEAEVEEKPSDNGGILLSVKSEDSAILIGRKGRTLSALQYLINRMAYQADAPETTARILIDIEGYLDRRKTNLEEIALSMANRVKQTGRSIRMKPMNPQERRIVHMALQDNPNVRTFSTGTAALRNVVIAPKDESQERPRRQEYNRGPREDAHDRPPRRHDARKPRETASTRSAPPPQRQPQHQEQSPAPKPQARTPMRSGPGGTRRPTGSLKRAPRRPRTVAVEGNDAARDS